MTAQIKSIDDLQLNITQEIRVNASLERTFESLLEQLGPYNETLDGRSLAMKIEPWPGGRWYRDLGDSNGHFWGNVQAIKKPTLLEISGPLFMSSPVANNLQYRLSEENGVTTIKFRHAGFGLVEEQHKTGVVTGWTYIHDKVRQRAEAARSKSAVQ